MTLMVTVISLPKPQTSKVLLQCILRLGLCGPSPTYTTRDVSLISSKASNLADGRSATHANGRVRRSLGGLYW